MYKMNKLIIIFKTVNIKNSIYDITNKYCNQFKENIDFYFLIEDNFINDDIIIEKNIIKVKLESNNWSSLLIKVIKAFDVLHNNIYSHIMVSNISSFINIPIILNKLIENKCYGLKAEYSFKNINYEFPSGAGYIFPKYVIEDICNFFKKNNYIINNTLTEYFINNYPTTDDLFFGYYFYKNKIKIEDLDRYDMINYTNIPNYNYSHYRIKTLDNDKDNKIFILLYENIYKYIN